MSISISSQIQLVEYFGPNSVNISSLVNVDKLDTIYRVVNGSYQVWINGQPLASNFTTLDPNTGYLIISKAPFSSYVLDDGSTTEVFPSATFIEGSIDIRRYFGGSFDLDANPHNFQQIYQIINGAYSVWIKDSPANGFSTLENGSTYLISSIESATFPYNFSSITQGDKLYLVSPATNSVKVVDLASNSTIGEIQVGTNPVDILLDHIRGIAYVANKGSQTISVLDLTTDTIINTILLYTSENFPVSKLYLDNNNLYACSDQWYKIFVIDTLTNSIIDDINTKFLNGTLFDVTTLNNNVYTIDNVNKTLQTIENKKVLQKTGTTIFGSAGDEVFGSIISTNNSGEILATKNTSSTVSVYKKVNNRYVQLGSNINIGSTITSLDISGNGLNVIIGSYAGSNQLGVRTGFCVAYRYINNQWVQLGPRLFGDSEDIRFGFSVAINFNGTSIACSEIDNTNYNGAISIFDYTNATWVQRGGKIVGIDGESLGNRLSIDDSGLRIAAGSPKDINGFGSVSVHTFDTINNTWTLVGFRIAGDADNQGFGRRVMLSASGNVLVSCSPTKIQAYQFNGASGWVQIGEDIIDVAQNVVINNTGDTLLINNPSYDTETVNNIGKVTLYKLEANHWRPRYTLTGTSANFKLGTDISIDSSGDIIFISSSSSDLLFVDAGEINSYIYSI